MYLIDKQKNRITKLVEKRFSDLGFKERENLQEWIANNPECLGEDLLIIQKEFSGFSDTKERLDLLALDKQGNIVVIENKLDDSGRDVTWQVIKYASYCSSLSKENIKNIYQDYLGSTASAEEKFAEFFDNTDFEELQLNQGTKQRIMMVAGQFRKEVTSTVLWLMNYKIRIQCFKVTPFQYGEELFLNVEQVLPIKDAEEYTISMAEKTQDDINSQETLKNRHHIRLDFWEQFIKYNNTKNNLTSNLSPSKDNWLSCSVGIGGLGMGVVVSKSNVRTELNISRGNKEENKMIFDYIFNHKEEIESLFGNTLNWERMDDNITSRIRYQKEGLNVYDKDDWGKMNVWLSDSLTRMNKSFSPTIKKLSNYLKNK